MALPKRARLFRKNSVWHISYWMDGRRVRESTGTPNRKVAEEVRLQREREMILGTVSMERQIASALCDPSRREALLTALAPGSLVDVQKALGEYEVHSKTFKRDKTIDNDQRRLKNFFDHVNVHYINDVTTKAVTKYIVTRVEHDHLSPATVLRYREILHAFYEFARKQGYVKANPIDGVPRPRIPDRDIRFLDLRQIESALEAVAGTPLEAVVATAIYSGMRREEICWLTVDDVDLTEGRPLIRVRAKTVGDESWMPKTKRNRTVPVSSDLYPYLARQALKAKKETWFFHTTEKCRWDPDNLSHHLSDLLDKKNLPWNFLDFRHSFGTILAQRGVSIDIIAELMGNSAPIAKKHYVRFRPEQMHHEVEFGSPSPSSSGMEENG